MFFLFALIILFLIIFIIHTSKIGIEVNNLIIDTEKNNGEKINKDSKIEIYLLLFNKVKFLRRDVRNMKMPNLKIKKQDIDIKVFKNKELDINYRDNIKFVRNNYKKTQISDSSNLFWKKSHKNWIELYNFYLFDAIYIYNNKQKVTRKKYFSCTENGGVEWMNIQ